MADVEKTTTKTTVRAAWIGCVALVAALVAPTAASAAGAPASAPASTQSVASSAAAVAELEAPDFASESFADPWDYSNVEDQNTDEARAANVRVGDGRLRLDVVGGDWFTPVATIAGSLAFGRDGAAVPVDPARYQRLSVKMDQPTNGGVAAVVWFTCREQTTACMGGTHFPTRAGDVVYDVDLAASSTIGGRVPWKAGKIVSLRVVPITSAGVTTRTAVSVDWLRLYAPGSAHGAWPPGTWNGFSVAPLPRPVVDSPAPSEGRDLASVLNGRPWDFTSAANAAGVQLLNARLGGYDSRGMTATNSGPIQNDPEVLLPAGGFSGSQFHHLSYSYSYDGPFSLVDAPGGGKMARLIWTAAGGADYQVSDDLVTYAGANARPTEIDLSARDPLDAQSGTPRLGWTGRTIQHLRFDPNEDPAAATWHLKYLHLREDPRATGSTTVRFHDAAWQPGTTAEVRVGQGAPGSPYETVARDVPVTDGVNSVRFDLGQRPAGSYRVEVRLRHADGSGALAFSRTAVTMTPVPVSNPEGSLDAVSRVPGGVRASGWTRDADTQAPLEVHAYDRTTGAFLGKTTAGLPRPDVQRAKPGAPLGTGYDVTFPLTAATSGRHEVCTYGINVGGGSNALLGCSVVTIDPRPTGSFDAATRSGDGVVVSGWTLDPDTAAPTGVHVYVSGRLAARLTADQARPDVARAWPLYGPSRGFSATVAAPRGSVVCTYAIDTDGRENTTLGCYTV